MVRGGGGGGGGGGELLQTFAEVTGERLVGGATLVPPLPHPE